MSRLRTVAGDPAAITAHQLREVYEALHLDRRLWDKTQSVLVEPHQVTVVRHATNEHGVCPYVGDDGEVVTEATEISVIRW